MIELSKNQFDFSKKNFESGGDLKQPALLTLEEEKLAEMRHNGVKMCSVCKVQPRIIRDYNFTHCGPCNAKVQRDYKKKKKIRD